MNIDMSRAVTQADRDADMRASKIASIKGEAYRRIVRLVPEWKQRNLTAQAAILGEKGRADWTAQELAAWEAGAAIWSQVAAIRTASDDIEAMDPLPADPTDDGLWP